MKKQRAKRRAPSVKTITLCAMQKIMRLGVNIDHIATLRQARRGTFPSPALASKEAKAGGASSITLHLREDRRHIQDADLAAVRKACGLPINLEMALNSGIVEVALKFLPEHACLVPERRQELTTEGGLDLISNERKLRETIPLLQKKKIQVSLFIDPDRRQIELAARLGAEAIEIHTGTYAEVKSKTAELKRIREAAALAKRLGLKVHAGHGLDYENTPAIAAVPAIEELNIGFSIISRAVFVGLRQAVQEMRKLINSKHE